MYRWIKNWITSFLWSRKTGEPVRFIPVEDLWVATGISSRAMVMYEIDYVFASKAEAEFWGKRHGFHEVKRLDRYISDHITLHKLADRRRREAKNS